MKSTEIKVGKVYLARINRKQVKVKVERIVKVGDRNLISYECTNQETGEALSLTLSKFLSVFSEGKKTKVAGLSKTVKAPIVREGKQSHPKPTFSGDVQTVEPVTGVQDGVQVAAYEDEESPDPTKSNASPVEVLAHGLLTTSSTQSDTQAISVVAQEGEQRLPKPTSPLAASIAAQRPVVMTSAVTTVRKSTIGLADQIVKAQAIQASGFQAPHVIVESLAGTGKTTTLIEGLRKLFGDFVRVTPSVQQDVVWNALLAGGRPRFSCFCAFSRIIADELKERIPKNRGCQARTLHSLGLFAVRKTFHLGEEPVNDDRVANIIEDLVGVDLHIYLRDKRVQFNAVKSLAGLCKQNLTLDLDVLQGGEYDTSGLDGLVDHYGVELPGIMKDEVYELLVRVLARCLDVGKDQYVDHDDMVWLPVILNLPVFKNDLLLVDEAQDLNRCQQQLAMMLGRRLILCGDPHQSIFAFAGADTESLERMTQKLAGDHWCGHTTDPLSHMWDSYGCCQLCNMTKERMKGPGCVKLALTVTRRCGKAIVREAQQYVPEFEAHPDNSEGRVTEALYPIQTGYDAYGKRTTYEVPTEKSYVPLVNEGDMVLCRANAPLVRECFRFLKIGKRASIQGRKEVGPQLEALIDRIGATSVSDLVRGLQEREMEERRVEMAKRLPNERRLEYIGDKFSCVQLFCTQASTIEGIKLKIRQLFTDDPHAPGIRLSSIHKAKGLEAKQVFYLRGFGPPRDRLKAWEVSQEDNLAYVAITRAIDSLVYVD